MSVDTWTGRTGRTGSRRRKWRTDTKKPLQTTKHKNNKDDDPKSGRPKEAEKNTSTLCGDTGKRGHGGGHDFYLFFLPYS